MFNIFKRKNWKESYELYKPYFDQGYMNCELAEFGVTEITTNKIIGLSLPENQLKNDTKMKRLIESVETKGWTNELPGTLHLYRLPNGNYTVGSGGNHRAYLANKLRIPKIHAQITIIIPLYIIKKHKAILDRLDQDIKYNDKSANGLNNWLQSKGVFREDYEEEQKYKYYCKKYDELVQERNEFLLQICNKHNMIPT